MLLSIGRYGDCMVLLRSLLEDTDLMTYFACYPEEAADWRERLSRAPVWSDEVYRKGIRKYRMPQVWKMLKAKGIETVEDLKGRSFAFGRRGSEQAGLVPHYLLKEAGINPARDLAAASFYEDRQSPTRSDERDVVERVASGEFDAGAVSQRTVREHGRGRHPDPRPGPHFLFQPALQSLLLHSQPRTGAGAGAGNRGGLPRSHRFR